MPELFLVIAGVGAAGILWMAWMDRGRADRLNQIVSDIRARGQISIGQTADGEPVCPHCGHSLRAAAEPQP